MRTSRTPKTLSIILKSKTLRVFSILSITFLILSITLASFAHSYENKIKTNDTKVQLTQKKLSDLQYLVNIETESDDDEILELKSFATYEEVIPFITFLESLFAIIDPNSEVTLKSNEKQIFIDHFANYKVNLETGTKKELFFKALDELHNTQFITKLMGFTMNYRPTENNGGNELYEVEVDIRLFLN